jgi:hypothetical protein
MAASGEYTSLETVGGLLAYTGVGLASGFLVNTIFPKCDHKADSAQLLFETAAQMGASYLLTTEVMRMVMPTRENWLPPASDASTLIGLWTASPEMRHRIGELLDRYTRCVRDSFGLDVEPPVPTEKAQPEEGGANLSM